MADGKCYHPSKMEKGGKGHTAPYPDRAKRDTSLFGASASTKPARVTSKMGSTPNKGTSKY